MNFRKHFEAWHKAKYTYAPQGIGTALNFKYFSDICQARWEAWQACADWHTQQESKTKELPNGNVLSNL